ncbi:hypothetical protein BgiBS90_003105 [Biomphalaria glabrata]|nr:hypothetical protein BgiBS90_003105 [Biomphalaria glabrata]
MCVSDTSGNDVCKSVFYTDPTVHLPSISKSSLCLFLFFSSPAPLPWHVHGVGRHFKYSMDAIVCGPLGLTLGARHGSNNSTSDASDRVDPAVIEDKEWDFSEMLHSRSGWLDSWTK